MTDQTQNTAAARPADLTYISVLRTIAMIVVVFFHTYGYMYAQAHFPQSVENYHQLYFIPNQCVFINIAMPLFTAISGYLFAYLYSLGKYREFWPFLKKKAIRLLLPFFVFGTLMMLTTGVPFRPWMLYTGSFSHLWYLSALFWCFPIGWLILRYCRNNSVYLVAIFAVLLLSNGFSEYVPCVLGIQYILRYYEWFLLGQILALQREPIGAFMDKWHLAIPLLLPFAILSWIFPDPYEPCHFHTRLMVSLFLVGLFVLADKEQNIAEQNIVIKSAVWFSKYTFGIYIFHNWIGPYMISKTAQRLFHLAPLASEHVILFPFVLSLMILGVSFVLSYALLKTKIGKMLIG